MHQVKTADLHGQRIASVAATIDDIEGGHWQDLHQRSHKLTSSTGPAELLPVLGFCTESPKAEASTLTSELPLC